MTERAPILVHGATGFTGALVCELLAKRGFDYAASGRSRDRLEALRRSLVDRGLSPPKELRELDLSQPATVEEAVKGRAIVLACAGPFVEIGEPVVRACAKLGVHYADTTGEQPFVAEISRLHHEASVASGACITPAMAFEIAPSDWACHLAAERVGHAPETIEVFYANRAADGAKGVVTTRGTKKSILRVLAERAPLQFVDGALTVERFAEKTTSFALPSGRRLAAASFPSPEAIVVPTHTGAKTVRTYFAMGETSARVLHRARKVAPWLVRATRRLSDRLVESTPEGPRGLTRSASFTIIAEATKDGARSRVAISGKDPYGLTAEIQVYAAARALEGRITARGVVAPSTAFPPREAIDALAHTGLSLLDPA